MILLTRMRSVPVACACTSWPIQRASAAAVLQIVPAAGTRATFSPVSERKMIGAGVPQACLRIGAVGSHSKASPASRREPSVRAVEISSHDHESCQSTHHLTIADAIGSIAEGLLCRSATSVRATSGSERGNRSDSAVYFGNALWTVRKHPLQTSPRAERSSQPTISTVTTRLSRRRRRCDGHRNSIQPRCCAHRN